MDQESFVLWRMELKPWYSVETSKLTHVPAVELNRKTTVTYMLLSPAIYMVAIANTKIPDPEWNQCNKSRKRSYKKYKPREV